MTILRSVLTGSVTTYTITFVTSTSTGAPIETLVANGDSVDIAEMKSRVTYDTNVNGNVKLEDFRFLSERILDPQTIVVEKDGVKYRIKATKKGGLNNKVFGYTYSCVLY